MKVISIRKKKKRTVSIEQKNWTINIVEPHSWYKQWASSLDSDQFGDDLEFNRSKCQVTKELFWRTELTHGILSLCFPISDDLSEDFYILTGPAEMRLAEDSI